MTKETDLKRQIKDYLNFKGIMWWYNLAGIGVHKGLPDLMALKEGMLYGIEVKAPRGKLSEYQQDFLETMNANGAIGFMATSIEDVIKHL